ncbi:hypothetical protein N7465_007526 [Penicillium sp. CMV-2018d]|nr:hypothetical protein N7465_007526 [Penicillium sp. CMV-2018d]
MSVANLVSGDITPLAMLFSRSHRHHLTFPHTHTRGQQIIVFLIMIMEIDHLEFILLPTNPQQPYRVSKRNLVNGERFNTIFF